MVENRQLPTRLRETGAVQLHDSGLKAGSLVEQSLAKLTPEQAQTLMGKAGDEALRLEVKRTEQNIDYVTGRKVVEDHIDTFTGLDKSGKLTSHKIVTDVNTGAGHMRIESKSGATCFVASAAYGDPNHADVVFLRNFRDRVLSRVLVGRAFISIYWRIGPGIACYVETMPSLRRLAKATIALSVRMLRICTRTTLGN